MTKIRLAILFTILMLVISGCCPWTAPDDAEDALPGSKEETSPQEDAPPAEEEPEPPAEEEPEPPEEEEQEVLEGSLSSKGPWWIFSTPDGLFAVNPDGSGLTQFYSGPVNAPWARQILTSPDGKHLAYLVGDSYDAALKITGFPSLDLIADKPLITYDNDQDMDAMRAIVEQPSMAFSPDGRSLAFMGVIDGPTSDLYSYSLDTSEITNLTDGPSQAYQPVWSPDGNYIVHTGVSAFGTGAGFSMSGIWASEVETTDALSLYDPSGSGSERIISWVDDKTFVVYSWDAMCGMNNVRTFNIDTQESQILWPESFRAIAFNPSKDVAVISSNDGTCAPEGGVGFYLVPTNGSGAFRFLDDTGPQGIWSEEAELILFLSDLTSGVIAVDSMGQYIDLDMPQDAQAFPAVAPASRDLAWGGDSLWVGPLLGSIDNPPQEIFSESVYNVTWTPDGDAVMFFSGSSLYIANKPDFAPVLISDGLDNQNGYSGWLIP